MSGEVERRWCRPRVAALAGAATEPAAALLSLAGSHPFIILPAACPLRLQEQTALKAEREDPHLSAAESSFFYNKLACMHAVLKGRQAHLAFGL